MIIARTPFRVSFGGGGSDLAEFYAKNGTGAVLSTTIDKYMYVMIHNYFHERIRIKYSKTEDVNGLDAIQHPLVRECLKMTGIENGVEIASIADVPAGTGVGSSSTFTVCLLHALHTFSKERVTREELAQMACKIEIDILKEPIGKQDQYAAAYGGLNFIEFCADGTVRVEPIACDRETKRMLENNLLMFYVGNDRKASGILSEQRENMGRKKEFAIVERMVEIARRMREALIKGNIGRFAQLLHEGWLLKKQVASKVSNTDIDRYYQTAIEAGALGGKLLGAGSGGFLLLYCEPQNHRKLRDALCLRELRFRLDCDGSKIVFTDFQEQADDYDKQPCQDVYRRAKAGHRQHSAGPR